MLDTILASIHFVLETSCSKIQYVKMKIQFVPDTNCARRYNFVHVPKKGK
jgi:hypothetical protein